MTKRIAILAAAMTTALALPQGLSYSSATGNIEVHGSGGRVIQDLKAGVWRFDVTGQGSKVHAVIRDEGLEFFADRVQGVAVPDPKKPGSMNLKNATASGGVRVIKTATGTRTEMTGAVAKFAGSGKGGTLNLGGPVKLTNFSSANSQNLAASGSSAIATLAAGGKKDLPLKTATLLGPVVIDASERNSKGGVDTVHVTGSRLDIDNTVKPAKLKLTGGVRMTSPQYGHFTGSQIVMTVNERGEVVSVDLRS
jgi:hypothetical protein